MPDLLLGAYKYIELTASASYPGYEVPSLVLDFLAYNFKFQAVGGDIEVSFDGKTTHTKVYAANGVDKMEDIPGVTKLWIKGTGVLRVTAWAANNL